MEIRTAYTLGLIYSAPVVPALLSLLFELLLRDLRLFRCAAVNPVRVYMRLPGLYWGAPGCP
jgi:hypothetical protein